MRIFFIFIALFLLPASWVQAQNLRYVTDSVEIPLRAGASEQHKVLRTLPSGSPLHVLGSDSKTGYTRVRTADGVQGWILTANLMSNPTSRQALEQTKTEKDALKTQINALLAEKTKAEAENVKLRESSQSLNLELAQFRKIASGEIDFDAQNKALQARAIQLERELQIVKQENQALLDKGNQGLLVTGAGVLFSGIVLGLLLPRLGGQRRGQWQEL